MAAVTTVDGDISFEDSAAQVCPMLHSSPGAVWWACDEKVAEASLCIPRVLEKLTPEQAQTHLSSAHCWIKNLLDANKKILGQAVDGGLKKMQGLLDTQSCERFPNVMGTVKVGKVALPKPCDGQEVDAMFLRLAETGFNYHYEYNYY